MSDRPLLISGQKPKLVLTGITKSFVYRLDMKRYDPKWYEHRDFFCSATAQGPFEDEDEAAKALHQFVKAQVVADLKSYIREAKQHLKEVA